MIIEVNEEQYKLFKEIIAADIRESISEATAMCDCCSSEEVNEFIRSSRLIEKRLAYAKAFEGKDKEALAKLKTEYEKVYQA